MTLQDADLPVSAETARQLAGLSKPAWWRAVADGRMPAPVYPAPRAPRWYPSEIKARLEQTRKLPVEAKAERREVRIAAERSARAGAVLGDRGTPIATQAA